MKQRRRWLGGHILLVPVMVGGCNILFGIQGGALEMGAGGAGGATSSTHTVSASHAATSSATASVSVSSTASSTSSGAGTGGSGPVLAVSPSSAHMLSLTTLGFTATLGGSPDGNVTWTVVEAGGGTVSASGASAVYRAPQMNGTFHLKATDGARSQEAAIVVQQQVTPVVLSATGELASATGHGTQSHLAYAAGTGQWWLFHDPASGGTLATLFSDDFATWQAGESIAFSSQPGPDGDGRDLSVAYASLNGHDVVHVSQGYFDPSKDVQGRYHLRAVPSAGHMAFGPPQSLNSLGGTLVPDGCATGVLANGKVIDMSGVASTSSFNPPGSLTSKGCGVGDEIVFESLQNDDGSSPFDSGQFSHNVLWCVANVINSHQLLPVGDSAVALSDAGGDFGPGNILSFSYMNATWTPTEPAAADAGLLQPQLVFPTNQGMDPDNWTAAVVNGAVHAVRLTGIGFEHAILPSVGGTWGPGATIDSTVSTLGGTGLFLAPYGDGVLLVALSAAPGNDLLYTFFDGALWSMWAVLTPTSTDTRAYLSGYAPPSGPKPALIWTVTTGMSHGISGLLLP